VGAVAYASGLVAAARVDAFAGLVVVLVVAGIGAAGVYAPALRSVAKLVPADRVGAAMGLVNALGALGMGLGGAGARAITKAAADSGADRAASLTWSLDVGAASLLLLVAVGAPLWSRQLARSAATGDDESDDHDDKAR
jgi:nitrate/nitrite transporter NarK